ncbi:MAG TPA: SRPBCC family protein [Acidimicrobiales bacterium]
MIEESGVTIDAPADHVWRVFTDVERWPEWTASVTRAEVVGGGGAGLRVGTAVRIKQPRFPAITWVVTELDPGVSWTWVARSPGATTVAVHEIEPLDAGTTRVRQRIEQTGPIGALVGRAIRATTRRYLATEAAGLKRRCEATRDAGAPGA